MAFLSEINTSVAEPAELFSDPPNQVAIQKIYFSEIRPVSSFDGDTAPLEFAVPGGGNEYIDLRRSRLYLKAKITKADGTTLATSEKTGIVNLPLQSLFSQIDVYMNGKCVSQNANNYPWKAYLKVLLSNGFAASNSQLQTQLYYPDKEVLDDPDPAAGRNQGLRGRYVFTQQSRTFDLEGPLYVDCFYLDKYLINGVDLQLRLFRSRNEFVLMSKEASANYKVTILDAVFKACKIRLDSGVLLNHANAITKSPARYHYLKTDIKMMTVSDKTSEVYWDDVWNGRRPSKMYVAFVKQSAVNGSYADNPFNFQHLDLSEIVVTVNGEPTPVRPLKMDFSGNRNYVTALCNLYQASEKWYKDDGLIIDRDQFSKGYAIYAFDLDPSDLGEGYINLVHQANVGVYARFSSPTTETVSALAFCEYPGMLLVDQTREIRQMLNIMDTGQLLHLVETLPGLKLHFRGVFACDTLPARVRQFPSAFVCNTDPIDEKGTHWVAYWFDNVNECEFYDSFGRLPQEYDARLKDFIDRNALLCLYNDVQVQPDSATSCGLHALFYLYCRVKGLSMTDVIRVTSEALVQDVILKGNRIF